MVKPTVPDLKELFKQAAEIAQQVPEAMQAAAFNRAVDFLTGAGTQPAAARAHSTAQHAAPKTTGPGKQDGRETGALDALLQNLDSTQHPDVRSSSTVLDRSLRILQIARTEHNVDGLTPADIARLLTEKFRIGTSDAAVRMALGNVPNLVNRVPCGKGFVYRIMGPGEEHLAALTQSDDDPNKERPPIPKRKRRPAKTTVKSTVLASESANMKTVSKNSGGNARKGDRKKGGASGPVITLNELVGSGFFDKHRTLMEIIEYCRTNKAKMFRPDQLSGPLARGVRDGRLQRQRNSDGQYEYWK